VAHKNRSLEMLLLYYLLWFKNNIIMNITTTIILYKACSLYNQNTLLTGSFIYSRVYSSRLSVMIRCCAKTAKRVV